MVYDVLINDCKENDMKTFFKNYGFITCMLLGIAGGCIVGLLWPQAAPVLAPLGTIFTNLMFCLVVPMVF